MKNGINVAAVSELVNEIRNVPHENEIDYSVGLSWIGGLNISARTRPLRFGTKVLGRDFQFGVGHISHHADVASMTPADYFMLGVGACVANILVQGASYKSITLEDMTVISKAKLTANQLEDFQVDVCIKSDGSRWQYKQMMMNVARFSPNFITLSLPNTINVNYQHLDAGPAQNTASTPTYLMPKPQPVEITDHDQGVEITWRNATQFDARRYRMASAGAKADVIAVDQPIPAAGLNEAPNPQEYILAAVAADLMQNLVQNFAASGDELHSLNAKISCRLDMKGCFNIFNKSAIQLQQNTLDITAKCNCSEEQMQQHIQQAKEQSSCYKAFINASQPTLKRED